MVDYVDALFNNLDCWRHLPAYQLERRADVFFSLYLGEIIESRFGCRPTAIIPEFPIHHPTIYPGRKGNYSSKMDYLAVLPGRRIVFVELKTDQGSRRIEQDLALEKAAEVGMGKLLNGLRCIYGSPKCKKRKKYRCLLKMLEDVGLVSGIGEKDFEVVGVFSAPQIFYVQPVADEGDERVMGFEKVADIVSRHEDALSRRFAASLREWATVAAGEPVERRAEC